MNKWHSYISLRCICDQTADFDTCAYRWIKDVIPCTTPTTLFRFSDCYPTGNSSVQTESWTVNNIYSKPFFISCFKKCSSWSSWLIWMNCMYLNDSRDCFGGIFMVVCTECKSLWIKASPKQSRCNVMQGFQMEKELAQREHRWMRRTNQSKPS